MTRAVVFALVAGLSLSLGGPVGAQDAPRVAGTDVPAPRRTKFVAPAYPPEAQMRGLRGIVILELVVDETGRIASADVVRSVPPFDEAALSAARQWEYEVTQVEGRPVRVRVTVPITFALKLPEMSRAEGIPEMRQGAAPGFPPGLQGPARVVADVTLMADGSVAEANVRSGESPWAEGLLLALRTWRFEAAADGAEVGFTVEANFVSPARTGQPPKVELKLTDPRRGAAPAASNAAAAPPPVPVASPAPNEELEMPARQPSPAPGDVPPPASAPSDDPASGAATPSSSAPLDAPSPAPVASPTAPGDPSAPVTPAAPPIEVITGPAVAPPPPPPPEPGFSAVRDVSLGVGVPDLVKGRRPVVPPVARMASASGDVEVAFAVDAAGIASVQKVEGPELLKEAARQAVASWAFRRTTAERIFLTAVFSFVGDQARAVVKRAE
jgi:TonB family protein